jgi:hypothetical protein
MTDRAEYIAGLRQLADLLEQNPDALPLPYEGRSGAITFHFLSGEDPKAEMAAAARAIPTRLDKSGGDSYFDLTGSLHGLKIELTAFRDAVCERVVTGTETVTEQVRDPEAAEQALASVPLVEVTRTIEHVEWRCTPLLADTSTLGGA